MPDPGRRRCGAPTRGAWAQAHLGMVVQVIVFTAAALVLLVLRSTRSHRAALGSRARPERRRGRRPAARRRAGLPVRDLEGADGLRLARGPAGLSDHRARDPLFPVAVTAHQAPHVAARRAVRGGGADAGARGGDVALSGRRRVDARPRRCGTPRIPASTTARSRSPSASTSSRSSKASTATGSTTTPTSGAASGWPSTRRCRASFAYALKDGVPIVAMLMGGDDAVLPVAADRVPAAARAAAGLRADLRGRRRARARSGAGAAPQPSVHARQPRARRDRVSAGAALVYALLQKNLLQIITSGSVVYLLLFVATLGLARYRDARAPVARPALLPRGVRRAQDPGVAGRPRPLRDRPRRSRGAWWSSRSTRRSIPRSRRCWPPASRRDGWSRSPRATATSRRWRSTADW